MTVNEFYFIFCVSRGIGSDPHNDIIGRDNLFSVKGARWKTIRAKVSPVFTSGKLKNLFLLMVDVSKVLEQKLAKEIGNEPKEYEMKKLASLFSTDTISLCAFGVEANSLLNSKAEFHMNATRTMDFHWRRAIEFSGCFLLPEIASILRFSLFSKKTNQFISSTINYSTIRHSRVKMFVLEVILGIVLCVIGFLWWWQRSARIYWEKNGVSYIPGPPLLGAVKDSILFKKSLGDLFSDLYNNEECKDDPITGVYFFHKPSLIIRHPEIIKNILVKDFPNFIDR
uniref:Uncharacterized protein n=1 Tax=Phlebotomus papatasi TaxID=29031 RepID=A0A1B0DJA0_PHLPP